MHPALADPYLKLFCNSRYLGAQPYAFERKPYACVIKLMSKQADVYHHISMQKIDPTFGENM